MRIITGGELDAIVRENPSVVCNHVVYQLIDDLAVSEADALPITRNAEHFTVARLWIEDINVCSVLGSKNKYVLEEK